MEERLSLEERRVRRAAFLRPMNLLMVGIGGVAFTLTLVWWIPPLTLATYAALTFLATRDPLFRNRIIEGRPRPMPLGNASPERRARWLPRGETRRKVEEALEAYRRAVFAIEESDDVARAVLDDAVPKLNLVAVRLVDVAEKRERAAGAIRELEARNIETDRIEDLNKEVRAADEEISDTLEKLSTLRARVVRVSLESGGAARDAAARLNADLDELNLRLDALNFTRSTE